jgi:type II secretory pathway pseudopilin PulG
MTHRWAPAFTIVEIVVVITAIAILAAISVIGYGNIQRGAMTASLKSDLDHAASEMQHAYQHTGSYPTSLPTDFESSQNINLTVKSTGVSAYYTNLTPVQNGVLFSQICQNLIDEGVGKGTDNGGTTQDYMTGCGNWNYDSAQITGWNTKKWYTPVQKQQLLDYANNFTTSDNWNKNQETVVKNFYTQLVERLEAQGGSFPITSFWDYWASPESGGVAKEPLGTPISKPYYCVEGSVSTNSSIIWHVNETNSILEGAC